MEPDFYQEYKNLPVPELVKVARTPSEYLPEAVAAAQRVLIERGITKEEIATEEWALAQKEIADGLRRGRLRDYREWIGELFGREKLTNASDVWFTVFLVLYGLYYVYIMYVTITELAWLTHCEYCPDSPGRVVAWDVGIAVYFTVSLYGVLKQVWLGWSLVMIQVVYYLCLNFSRLFHFYMHNIYPYRLFPAVIFPVVVYAALGFILWKKYVIATFDVTTKVKSRTMLVGVVLGVVGMMFG